MDAVSGVGLDPAITQVDKGFGSLDADQFTELILTELANQDPLEPNDTSALLDQLSTIRSIESDTELNDTLAQLADRSDFTAAAGLIGTQVTTNTDGTNLRDVVSVSQSEDGVSVTLSDGSSVPLSSVVSVFGDASGSARSGGDA
ncbi:MAG: flagellar hook capping FlgD N-terminal domain-containing protein [Planctomycetota bacterium]